MASKFILTVLFLSLLFISDQVSSDFESNEETDHVDQALHVFDKPGNRKLLHRIVRYITKYFQTSIEAESLALTPASAPAPAHPLDCGRQCKIRCSLHSRPNLCIRACGTCCARCKCVPPGTFGNREVCGKCYTDMTTHHNQTKCP